MSVKLWDAGSGRERATFSGHTDRVYSAVMSRDNRLIASASQDGTVRIWDTETGKESFRLEEIAYAATFDTDNNYLFTFSADGIKQWDVRKGKFVKLITEENITRPPTPADTTVTSNDGRYLASFSKDGEIILYDLLNPDSRRSFSGHNGDINSLSFSSDSRYIVSASSDKTVRIWNTGGTEETVILGGHSDPPVLSVISHDTQYIASLNRQGVINIWNAQTGVFIESFDGPGQISSMIFSTDNESLITVSPDGIVANINIKTGKMHQLTGETARSAARLRSFGAGGGSIVSVLWDGSIEIWDYMNGGQRNLPPDDNGLVWAVGLCPDGNILATGHMNGKLRIIDLNGGKKQVSLQYKSAVVSVDFSADGQRLACGLWDGSVRLLDVSSGKEIVPAMRHLFGVSSVSFSADGKYLISGAADNSVNLWNAQKGTKIASFISFDDNEWITITPDGYYNASPRGDERLNVRIGNGINGEIYGMDQFSAVFFQAEVVSARLQGQPDPDSVTQAENRHMALTPPSIQINAPVKSDTGMAEIGIFVKDRFRPLNTIQIVINGRLLGPKELVLYKSSADLRVHNTSIIIENSKKELELSIPVNLETGSNRIQIIATNKGGQSEAGAEGRKTVYIVNNSETVVTLPDLWVLTVGSNRPLHGRTEGGLKFAVNNAQGIKTLFEARQGKPYQNVYTHLIADEGETALTRKHILDTMLEFFGKAHSNDVLVLFLSGHGEDRNGNGYYFLPQAISLDDIAVISDMPGRKFIFIDSCFSGGVNDTGMARNLKNQSTVIFTSSQKNERSWEGSGALSYGFFTDALISGISGEAAKNNEVRLLNLGEYVYSKVMLLSSGTQHPYVYIPEGFWGVVLATNPY
jgi:WD40 repeat protein